MESYMKDNSNIIYKKVNRRKHKQEYQVNEGISAIMLSRFVKSQGHDESIMEGVKDQDDPTIDLV